MGSGPGLRTKKVLLSESVEIADCCERAIGAASAQLIAGTEAFLSGDYANHLHRGGSVSVWARLNALAHCDIGTLKCANNSFVAMRDPRRSPIWPMTHGGPLRESSPANSTGSSERIPEFSRTFSVTHLFPSSSN